MQQIKYLYFVLCLAIILFTGCDKGSDNTDGEPNLDRLESISLKSEGEETSIQLAHSNWIITSIVDKSNNERIKGVISTLDDQIIAEDKFLSLKGLGKLGAKFDNMGFLITREIPTRLKIKVEENKSGKDFVFAIVIETDNVTTEFVFEQKPQ